MKLAVRSTVAVVAANFPRLFEQAPGGGNITLNCHPGRAQGDYGIIRVYRH